MKIKEGQIYYSGLYDCLLIIDGIYNDVAFSITLDGQEILYPALYLSSFRQELIECYEYIGEL